LKATYVDFCIGGEILANESKYEIPEPKITPEGRYKCPEDNTVYARRKDYEKHCKKEHQR
jgi:hypothetical protein